MAGPSKWAGSVRLAPSADPGAFGDKKGTMSAGGAQGRRRGEGHLGRRSIDLSGALSIFKPKLGDDILKK